MVMRIDNITNRDVQFFFNKRTHRQSFLWKRQCINNHGPLRACDRSGCYLGIYLALEPINILRDSFSLHTTFLHFLS